MLSYYVFLMPDGRLVTRARYSHIKEDEATSLDCWVVEARNMQDAQAQVVLNLYKVARRFYDGP